MLTVKTQNAKNKRATGATNKHRQDALLPSPMERRAPDSSQAPLVVAVRQLAAVYSKTANSLKTLVDHHEDALKPQPELPHNFEVPLPRSLLTYHHQFVDELLSAIFKLRAIIQSLEAWAFDLQITIRDMMVEAKRSVSNRSSPY